MELTDAQLQRLAKMLGEPRVTWSKAGMLTCAERDADMDTLVRKCLLTRRTEISMFGDTVITYEVTQSARRNPALVLLLAGFVCRTQSVVVK